MPRAVSAVAKSQAPALWAGLFVLVGLAAAIAYLLVDSTTASGITFAVVGAGAAASLVIGSGRNSARPRWPWLLLGAASVLFVIGAIVRPWSTEQTGATELMGDAFTLPGYVLMFAALVGFLTVKHGPKRHAVIDGMLLGLGAGLIFALLFSVPAAGIADRSAAVSTVAGLYPIFDLVLVLLVANVAFTTAIRGPSYLMLIGSMVLLLAGDIGYAIIGVNGTLNGNRLIDLPFLLGFVLIGACALHPSMRHIGRRTPLPVQAWSWRRLLLLIPALAVPFVLTATIPDLSRLDRIVLAVGGALMVALLLLRSVSAVQAYAAAQREYEYQATHDHLTALPNRALLVDQVGQILARPTTDPDRPLWLYFLDLDGFKLVNDSWGHYAGDRVIVEVARRLRRTVPAGAAVARVGGDEFVIAHVSTADEAIALAERVLASLTLPLQATASDVVVSGSIGIAGSAVAKTDDAGSAFITAEGLLRDADTAMYQAKAEGRGRWVLFDSTMHDRVRDRIELELSLRHALAHDQLRLAYQPIVRLSGARLTGVEALIRWEHPTRGTIAPTKFIPVAEETGLITDLGRWVMREALRQLAEWRRNDVVTDEFWLSINVSPRQLRDPRLPGELAEALAENGLSGESVMLEITESVMVDGSQVTDQVMADLRGLGVRLVVDDFGTGFSALGYLRRHPVTGVKIDRSFVGGLGTNPEDEEIVRAVVAMSSALGLTVVAEGVQTQSQRDVLQALGVVYGQGWLWGRPQDPETFARLRRPAAIGRGGDLAPASRPTTDEPKRSKVVEGFPRLGPTPGASGDDAEAARRLLDPIPGEPPIIPTRPTTASKPSAGEAAVRRATGAKPAPDEAPTGARTNGADPAGGLTSAEEPPAARTNGIDPAGGLGSDKDSSGAWTNGADSAGRFASPRRPSGANGVEAQLGSDGETANEGGDVRGRAPAARAADGGVGQSGDAVDAGAPPANGNGSVGGETVPADGPRWTVNSRLNLLPASSESTAAGARGTTANGRPDATAQNEANGSSSPGREDGDHGSGAANLVPPAPVKNRRRSAYDVQGPRPTPDAANGAGPEPVDEVEVARRVGRTPVDRSGPMTDASPDYDEN
ncbi:diguanylate cyclase (GGDEF) domain-containing protein [Asanoa hainanensis]|uniref:Diguanylate cyclase (GGDEF) domain-containing protein n=1 Tax=Asanoa hainanensis TaxID=560556 RepID=A0A239LBP7_9ACTN|nr:bifunctional diguanylate cyclase/phosphodiesterase [Asanoa hainanensis]SNT27263.1 diguanylate cyclase (GGDEF) domain-containing protein [Asanoa hainanensis]